MIKKCFCIWFLAAFLISAIVNASGSKETMFVLDVLQSLHYCQWAMDYDIKENDDDLAMMMSDIMTANNNLEDAKIYLQKYVDDKDENYKRVSEGMILGSDMLIDGNHKLIDKMRKASNLDP